LLGENTNYVDYLVNLSKEGRTRSFIDLCEINLRNVFSVIYRLMCDNNAARSMTISTFLRAWERIEEYDDKKSFALWIKKLAIINTVLELQKNPRDITLPQNRNNFNNELDFLESLIISLPTNERIIFVLHDLEGYSYEEISTSFVDNMVIDEVRSILIKTRETMMEQLKR
jgi:RNA polymerase sigma-70 factor (ECF subfamily)